VGQAAVPGGLLAILAAGLRWFSDPRPAGRATPAVMVSGASSLTRTAAPTVSLIVAPSAASTPRGRDAP
jgi:hypothetical protein